MSVWLNRKLISCRFLEPCRLRCRLGFYKFFKVQIIERKGLWVWVGLGGQLHVHLRTTQTTSFLRRRTSPQLRSLSDFQGPTSASSSSRNRLVCRQEMVWSGRVCQEWSRRCILRSIRLIFFAPCVPHLSWETCLIFTTLPVSLRPLQKDSCEEKYGDGQEVFATSALGGTFFGRSV
jgi:hypothetical protein